MCVCLDNQDVGLEAAMHLKSALQLTGLVDMRRQYTGLSVVPKQRTVLSVVGELSMPGRSRRATVGGLHGSENAGMSNERGARNPSAVSLRVPGQG